MGDNLIDRARNQFACDDIEIDNDAKVSESSDGVWVQAWVWLDNEEVQVDGNIVRVYQG
tara:strand:- start:797 stop:973 length:177 start_codon:yes stop_codon:yes gene_type:complete